MVNCNNNSLTLWHGSVGKSVSKFNEGSHFGSWLQALGTIVAHAALDNEDGVPCLYKCKVRYVESSLVRLRDWGTPNMRGALLSYCTEVDNRDKFVRDYRRILDELDGVKERDECIKFLKYEMNKNGHEIISYPNEVEGEGDSYCILEPAQIRIVGRRRPSFAGISIWLRKAGPKRFGFNCQEWNEISAFLKKFDV